MSQPTEGAVEPIEVTDKDSAALALEERWNQAEQEESPDEEEVQEENTDTETEVEEEEDLDQESESDTPDEQDDEAQFETIDDLAEALDMDTETFLSTIKATRKVNGEVEEVTLAELRDGNMKEADYRRKTTELAEQRKAIEQERIQQTEQLQTSLAQVNAMLTNAEQELANEYNAVNWNELKDYDKEEYLVKESEFRKRQEQIQAERQRANETALELQQQRQQQDQAELRETIQNEQAMLEAAIPEWNNDEVRQKEQAQMIDFLKERGFSENEFLLQTDAQGNITHPGLIDHRVITVLRDAMKVQSGDAKAEAAKKKVKTLPKVLKPGNKQTRQELNQIKRNEKLDRFKKTGSRDDLIKALEDRM